MDGGGERVDIAVVGAGMIGSAAAKHIKLEEEGLRVALIGPGEPADRSSRDILGAYYDEGRITRVLDPDLTWARLAQRSIGRYRQIEQQSGFHFYDEVGFLCVAPKDGESINNIKSIASELAQNVEYLDLESLKTKFPYMSFGENLEGIYARTQGGAINPRRLVEAQQKIASDMGTVMIDDVVECVEPFSGQVGGHVIRTAGGLRFEATRVLLATGAFTTSRTLLPDGIRPKLDLWPTMVILVEIEDKDLAHFEGMPSVVHEDGFSMPPVKYPDGKYYLKSAAGRSAVKLEQNSETIHNWYCHGRNLELEDLTVHKVKERFPGIKMTNYKFDHCVVTVTPTNQMYVSMVTPSLGVAIGGCGYAAKSSDELGLMAARMIIKGRWDYDLPEDNFRFLSEDKPDMQNT